MGGWGGVLGVGMGVFCVDGRREGGGRVCSWEWGGWGDRKRGKWERGGGGLGREGRGVVVGIGRRGIGNRCEGELVQMGGEG